jgi:hypothetical protein
VNGERAVARDVCGEEIEVQGYFCKVLATVLNSVLDSFGLFKTAGAYLQSRRRARLGCFRPNPVHSFFPFLFLPRLKQF